MEWLKSILQALVGGEPIVVLAVVVLAFVFLIYRLGVRVLTTIERIARLGERR